MGRGGEERGKQTKPSEALQTKEGGGRLSPIKNYNQLKMAADAEGARSLPERGRNHFVLASQKYSNEGELT